MGSSVSSGVAGGHGGNSNGGRGCGGAAEVDVEPW